MSGECPVLPWLNPPQVSSSTSIQTSALEVSLPEDPPEVWTAEWVMKRLIDAFDTLRRMPLRCRPKQFSVAWPQIVYDEDDKAAQREGDGPPRRAPRPSRDSVTLMEEAITWPWRYLPEEGAAELLACALAQSQGREYRRRGRDASAGREIIDRAEHIARMLVRDGVMVR
jgi:hypothetical protein